MKSALNIEFEQDWFRRYVTRQKENLKNIILLTRIFQGKANSVILLRFECTITPQKLMKIVGAIFGKMKFFVFFLRELPLILRVDRKRARDIFARVSSISNFKKIG